MALVPIDQLGLGMTLAEDVTDMNGRQLVSKGVCIEARHMRVLKMWGVCEVSVEKADPEPEVPSVVFELNEIIADPLSSSADIARLVNQSPSLAALLLKIVNSAFYGFRSKIDSISRAVVMIGSKEISNLALGITIMESFKDIPRQVMDVTSFMELGKKLIQKWKLPYALENNVLYHHNPAASPNPEAAAVVQMADIIMHGLGFSGSGEHRVPGFDAAAWDRLKIPAGTLPAVVRQAVHQIDNFRKPFT